MCQAFYHVCVLQADGSVLISWNADGFEAILVRARFRPQEELLALARGVADVALMERSLSHLGTALRHAYPGAFDLTTRRVHAQPGRVVVSFHPPKGTPNPDLGG